ncbi:hypothetical protein SAMN04489761_2584 [Tenacibaculum sp. MAR_2009_124]|uniref:hypothetical protein n=1 Tax=Tenacibaculum sp. MAR_2009_124 TaxID=1250059 RepID=UPI00089BFFAA|nr:hypothetical protein [Tenacibaculum sp. MAR_2009_124]SEC28807.1 hypothetical protein SAMN04489761_2584 [Tenacibaculum sp. MAR_2009_124]
MKNIFFYPMLLMLVILSSCASQKETLNKEALSRQIKQMVDADQKNRLLLDELRKSNLPKEVFKRKRDSIWKVQLPMDEQNTIELIAITKKHGFPNTEFLEKPIGAWVIFQHTPEKYKAEVKQLLIKEINTGRMPAIEGSMIMWHLHGRNGIPWGIRDMGVIVKDLRTKNDTINK